MQYTKYESTSGKRRGQRGEHKGLVRPACEIPTLRRERRMDQLTWNRARILPLCSRGGLADPGETMSQTTVRPLSFELDNFDFERWGLGPVTIVHGDPLIDSN
jgi:hypothetical protein